LRKARPYPGFCTLFKVLEKGPETEKGIRLVVLTDRGPKTVWCSKRRVNLYRFRQDGQTVREAAIPDWLAEQAGLI
jgi:hypothetical protein